MSKLTAAEMRLIDEALEQGASIRGAARDLKLPYGQVRGYVARRKAPEIVPPPPGQPAVLFYDIETAPALAWMWGAYQQNIIAIEQDWYMLSFAYKWQGGDKVRFVGLNEAPEFRPDSANDEWLVRHLHQAFDAADLIVAHNGDKFDKRKANARFLYHGMAPPSPYQTVDTAKVARRYFANYKNNLDDLGRLLELGKKLPNEGFHLWRSCMAGDQDAWDRMRAYNLQDVALLERLYDRLLPWLGTPGTAGGLNRNHFADEAVCPKCGSYELTKRGTHRTAASEFQTYQCKTCGGYSRAKRRDRTDIPLR